MKRIKEIWRAFQETEGTGVPGNINESPRSFRGYTFFLDKLSIPSIRNVVEKLSDEDPVDYLRFILPNQKTTLTIKPGEFKKNKNFLNELVNWWEDKK